MSNILMIHCEEKERRIKWSINPGCIGSPTVPNIKIFQHLTKEDIHNFNSLHTNFTLSKDLSVKICSILNEKNITFKSLYQQFLLFLPPKSILKDDRKWLIIHKKDKYLIGYADKCITNNRELIHVSFGYYRDHNFTSYHRVEECWQVIPDDFYSWKYIVKTPQIPQIVKNKKMSYMIVDYKKGLKPYFIPELQRIIDDYIPKKPYEWNPWRCCFGNSLTLFWEYQNVGVDHQNISTVNINRQHQTVFGSLPLSYQKECIMRIYFYNNYPSYSRYEIGLKNIWSANEKEFFSIDNFGKITTGFSNEDTYDHSWQQYQEYNEYYLEVTFIINYNKKTIDCNINGFFIENVFQLPHNIIDYIPLGDWYPFFQLNNGTAICQIF